MRSQTGMGENWDALFVAIVSKEYLTSDQAFMALKHGGWTKARGSDNRAGRRKMEIDYDRVLELKEHMTWDEIGKALGMKSRTLSRRVLAYVKEMKAEGLNLKIGGKCGCDKAKGIDIEKALELKVHMTWPEVAAALRVKEKTLKSHVYRYKARHGLKTGKPGRKVVEVPIEKALELKEHMTWAEVSEILGINVKTLRKHVYEYKNRHKKKTA